MKIQLGFGKYKGYLLCQVPTSYLEYIKSSFTPSTQLHQDVCEELKKRPNTKQKTYVHDWTAVEWDSEDWDYEDHEY
jgi:hypothetical protein